MGLSIIYEALREDDADHRAKVVALRACRAARSPVPRELDAYFVNGHLDEDAPLAVRLSPTDDAGRAVDSWDMPEHAYIDLATLPPGTRRIRVTFAY